MRVFILLTLFSTFSFFLNAWGLKSESIIKDIPDNKAEPRDYGYFVLIHAIFRIENKLKNCGGTIISSKYAVTAGNCLNKPEWAKKIFVGPPMVPLTKLMVDKTNNYKVHRAYVFSGLKEPMFLMGMIKLKGEFISSSYEFVRTLDIPPVGYDYSIATEGKVLGTGFTIPSQKRNGGFSIVNGRWEGELRFSNYQIINNENLPLPYSPDDVASGVTLTANEPHGLVTPLDTGGPFVFDNKLIGVIIGTFEIQRPNDRTVTLLARVSYYRDLIDKVSRSITCNAAVHSKKLKWPRRDHQSEF